MKRSILILGLVAALSGCAVAPSSTVEVECTGLVKSGAHNYTVPIYGYNAKFNEYKAGGAFQGRWVEASQFVRTDCPVGNK